MSVALPAPGGSVGLKTMAVYVAGGAAGIYLYSNYISPHVPDNLEQGSVLGVSYITLWFALSAMVGAAMAAKLVDHAK